MFGSINNKYKRAQRSKMCRNSQQKFEGFLQDVKGCLFGLTKIQGEIWFCLPKSKEVVLDKGNWGPGQGRQASKTCSIQRDGTVGTSSFAAVLFLVSLSPSQVHFFNNPLPEAALYFAFISLIKKKKKLYIYIYFKKDGKLLNNR